MTDLASWLEPRLLEAPESLRDLILDEARATPTSRSPIPEALKDLGERMMEEAQSAPPTHDTAMLLLAADALMTFAVEAVAESDPEQLMEMK